MPEKGTYHEELLHWIWQTSRLQMHGLHTSDGQKVTVFDPGTLNRSDGPDFLHATIQFGNLTWFGDVEIHWSARDWFRHKHQYDEAFNRVVLHVVWQCDTNLTARRQDGTLIPALALKPHAPESLSEFFRRYKKAKPDSLPCSGLFSYLPTRLFRDQLTKAHKEYFEQKVDDIYGYYDPELAPFEAWKKALATALFDGLGIAQNREPMRKLCRQLHPHLPRFNSREDWVAFARSEAFAKRASGTDNLAWKRKGSRPANHPETRVGQAAEYFWFIDRTPVDRWLKYPPSRIWRTMNGQASSSSTVQSERAGILYGTVWLPAIYMLGHLSGSGEVQAMAYEGWCTYRTSIPGSLLKQFRSLDIPTRTYDTTLGSIYQLRTYCRLRKCQRCKVFKNAISS